VTNWGGTQIGDKLVLYMLDLTIFTSMSIKYYKLIGKRMLESVQRHFAGNIRVYTEDFGDLSHPGVDMLPLSYNYYKFIGKHKDSTNDPANIQHQAAKFAPKAFAIINQLYSSSGLYLWLDADTYMFKPLEIDFDPPFLSYLPRPAHRHMCSSMMLFNCSHPARVEFQSRLAKMYSGELFKLPEWHDAYVLDHGVIRPMLNRMDVVDLGDGSEYPCVNGKLGQHFDHLRGRRKYDPTTYRESSSDDHIVPASWKPEWNVYK